MQNKYQNVLAKFTDQTQAKLDEMYVKYLDKVDKGKLVDTTKGPEPDTDPVGNTLSVFVQDIESDMGTFLYVDQSNSIRRRWELPILNIIGEPGWSEPEDITYTFYFPSGWSYFSVPLDIGSITSIEYNGTTTNVTDSDRTTIYHGYNNSNTYFTTNSTTHAEKVAANYITFTEKTLSMDFFLYLLVADNKVTIAKNNMGSAYLPEWNFNGIGLINPNEGYQLKLTEACSLTIVGKPYYKEVGNTVTYGRTCYYPGGWNMVAFPMIHESGAIMAEYAEDIFDSNLGDLIISKDYLGNAYLPEWNFNGIGDMVTGQAYKTKFESTGNIHTINMTF
tara:strand:+ start:253 stop:1254 length:1002 start_codon:yes stop_codon:yes gene_type:complete